MTLHSICPICQAALPAQADASSSAPGLPMPSACPRCAAVSVAPGATEISLSTSNELAAGQPTISLRLSRRFLEEYRLERTLGIGGAGVVFLATKLDTHQQLAIKFLSRPEDPKHVARFASERNLLSSVVHPHVLRTFTMGEVNGHPYLVTEYLPGGTLRKRVEGGQPLPLQEALTIAVECLSGLQACHARGIVHRDFKPENVLFEAGGASKIADFGTAKAFGGDGSPLSTNHQTLAGSLLGTPRYMAPEQVRGETAQVATDLYAFGLVLYEMLAGRHPFEATTLLDWLNQHTSHEPQPLVTRNPSVPQTVAWLVHRCLAKRTDERPRSAQELAVALSRFLEQTPDMGGLFRDMAPGLGRSGQWTRPALVEPEAAVLDERTGPGEETGPAAAEPLDVAAIGGAVPGPPAAGQDDLRQGPARPPTGPSAAPSEPATTAAQTPEPAAPQEQSRSVPRPPTPVALMGALAVFLGLVLWWTWPDESSLEGAVQAGDRARGPRRRPPVTPPPLPSPPAVAPTPLPTASPSAGPAFVLEEVPLGTSRGLRLSSPATTLSLLGDGRRLFTADVRDLTVWDLDTSALIQTSRAVTEIRCAAVSGNGKTAITGSSSGHIELWDLEAGLSLRTFQAHQGPVTSLDLSEDGTTALSSGEDGRTIVWNAGRQVALHEFQGHGRPVRTARLMGADRVVTAGADGTIRLWDLTTSTELTVLSSSAGQPTCLTVATRGLTFYSGHAGGRIDAWLARDGQRLTSYMTSRAAVVAVTVSPDGLRLAALCDDRTVRVWDLESGLPCALWADGGAGDQRRNPIQLIFMSKNRLLLAGADGLVTPLGLHRR